MKKRYILLTLILSVQVMFSGCSLVNKLKGTAAAPKKTSSTQSTTAASAQTAQKSTSTDTTTSSNNNSTTDTSSSSSGSTDTSSSTDNSTNKNTTGNSAASEISIDKTATPSTSSQTSSKPSSASATISKNNVLSYMDMTKTNLIKTLGKYTNVSSSSLAFSNGLTFNGLSTNQSKPNLIKCSNSVNVMGIKNGMSFSQVESVLGKTNVIDTYIGTKDNKAYKIQYTYGNDLVKVISSSKDGKNSYIEICPK